MRIFRVIRMRRVPQASHHCGDGASNGWPVAQYDASSAGQRTAEGMAAARAMGIRLGRPPFGFRVVDGALVEDPALAAEVARRLELGQRIALMRADWLSLRQVTERLAEAGEPTARGGVWTAAAVQRLERAAAAAA